MRQYILHSTIIALDLGPSCLLVRHQQIGSTLVQDSDMGVRPYKPGLHHGTALLQPGISSCHVYGSLNPDAPGIYIQALSKMNDTDDSISCLSVCLSWKHFGIFF